MESSSTATTMSSMKHEGMFPDDVLYASNGLRRTRALFREVSVEGDSPVFTLVKSPGYIKIKDLYIKFCVDDPTEATFALTVFGDIAFWENIAKCSWIQEHLGEWRRTTEVMRKAKAFEAIISEVNNAGRSSFSAAKFLIEEPWKDKRKPGVKAKSKESSDKAYGTLKDDVKNLKDAGLLN